MNLIEPDKIVRRHLTAHSLNEVVNDPSVYPWVSDGLTQKPLDLTGLVRNSNNILLMGEHGGVLFVNQGPGAYEAHTQVLPAGRGKWTVDMVRAALHWLFTRTEAVEVMTRIPYGNIASRALVKSIHGVFEFRREHGWMRDGQIIPADFYGLRIQDWMRTAPGLEERGEWFHHRLEEEYKVFGKESISHGEDKNHDRYVGAAIEMILGGQPYKGVLFYNRWAVLCGYLPVTIESADPLVIDLQESIISVKDKDFRVLSCQ